MNNRKDADNMILKDEEQAFTILYNKYKPIMLKSANAKSIGGQEAEDMIHEIFTSLWQRRSLINIKSQHRNYLLRAVHLQYAQYCRRSTVIKKYEYQITSSSIGNYQNNPIENKELNSQLRLAIDSISAPACRKIFTLAYIEDKKCNEIASELKIKPQVVRNQITRALKIIRQQLTE